MNITELFSHERYMAATCSGYTPEAVLRMLDRIEAAVVDRDKRISELEAELKPVVKQYYYRVSGCKAKHATDPDCICWHDKGTGPMTGYEETSTLEWRTKPNPDKQRIAELESEKDTLQSEEAKASIEKLRGLVDMPKGRVSWGINKACNRITELERAGSDVSSICEADPSITHEDDGCPTEGAVLRREWREMKRRIAELEAQVPKTVTPKCVGKGVLGFNVYRCNCDTSLCPADFYCPGCGAKLDWSES